MPKTLSVREETAEERNIREWFSAQSLESPKNVEEAGRLLIGLVTGLLSLIFGVLTVSAEHLPSYLASPIVKTCSVAAVILWLLCLLTALFVVLPRRWQVNSNQPLSESETFARMVRYKSSWLTISAIAFGLAVVCMSIVLVIALLAS
jgi:hypothetical protein